MINDLSPDTGSPHSRDSNRQNGFNPNDASSSGAGGIGDGGDDGTQYTSTKPIEQASESHTLPGPNSTGAGQESKGHNPTQ